MEEIDAASLGDKIFNELLSLVGKTALKCDGKIYKESRQLTNGEYVLCKAAVRELNLGVENLESTTILGNAGTCYGFM